MQETQEMQVQSLDQEDPLEKGMATHSRILAWRIPWTEELSGLQSIGLQRVRHDWGDLADTHTEDKDFLWELPQPNWFLREPYRVILEFSLYALLLAQEFPSLWLPAWGGKAAEMKGWSARASLSGLCLLLAFRASGLSMTLAFCAARRKPSESRTHPQGSVEASPEESVQRVSEHCHDHQ